MFLILKNGTVEISEIIKLIHKTTHDNVEFETLKYALKPKHNVDKIEWKPAEHNGAIPLLLAKDGWLECELWFETKNFLHGKQPKPLPT